MKEGYIIRDQFKPHFITATIVDWIDVFTRKEYRDAVCESLNFCIDNKGMILYGYVIMSNHIHLVVQSEAGDLSGLIRDFKKFTAKTILEAIVNGNESRKEWMLERFKLATTTHSRNKDFQLWQYGNHAEEIYSEAFLWSKLNYTHLNPVRAGWVEKASDYIYSSAGNYSTGKGIVKVTIADNPVVDVHAVSNVLKYDQY